MNEVWLPIPDFDGYRASNLGRIASSSRGVMKPFDPFGKDYLYVRIRKWGEKPKLQRVNRLVCLAFHGKPPTPEHHSAHLNGDRRNNRPDNLEWKTPLDNVHDRFRHGTMLSGPTHPSSKLSLENVTEIRARYTAHMEQRREGGFQRPRRGFLTEMAREYKIGICAMLDVVRGRTWADPFYEDSVEQRFDMRARTREASKKYRADKRKRKQMLADTQLEPFYGP